MRRVAFWSMISTVLCKNHSTVHVIRRNEKERENQSEKAFSLYRKKKSERECKDFNVDSSTSATTTTVLCRMEKADIREGQESASQELQWPDSDKIR